MACYIFGAGSFYGIQNRPGEKDCVIAADAGYLYCQKECLNVDLLIGDFDSLGTEPDNAAIIRVPVEKDDTDMMLAVKEGLARGETEFHLYGGMGGQRSDHTLANLQALLFLVRHGAHGWLYGDREVYTAIGNEALTFSARQGGTLSVFCMGADAEGVSISGGQYSLRDARLTADFPLGVSNHFVGEGITVSVKCGSLLIGLLDK